ncbi:hypothetical protein GW17_00012029 [Ensete ventricosum]|nr:hypothetical protein GW17_00012029 [Ensete ventricosum]RZR87973.1 hypothetical protein BHM03_00015446 [Ensete ventricosum]
MEGFEENYDRGSRIPHTFRAAKPFFLLACKRSNDALSPPPSSKCPRRVPLSEIKNGCSTPPMIPTPRSCHRDSIVSPSSSVIDEDFDEAFLRDVDALCEERSTAKKEKPSEENGKASWRRVVDSGEELDLALQRSLNMDAGDWPVQQQKDRIGAVAGKAVAKDLEISTFHSFCLQLCRRHAEKCVAPFLIVEINAFIL